MTEELRDVLLERFVSVYSGYGATDIEIGMAGESPVSIAVRRLARARPDIGRALFGTDSRLPMVFQYNPLIHFMEVNAAGEVICTVSAGSTCSRRGSATTSTTRAGSSTSRRSRRVLRDVRLRPRSARRRRPRSHGPRGPLPWAKPIPLPFLWIHGRRDATISVMGSNIYPEDIESVLYRDPGSSAAAPLVHAVGRRRRDRDAAAGRRARADATSTASTTRGGAGRGRRLRDGLVALNIDYRSSLGEFPAAMLPIVSTLRRGRRAVRRRRRPDQAAPDRPVADRGQSRARLRSAALTRSSSVPPIVASASAIRDASRASASE